MASTFEDLVEACDERIRSIKANTAVVSSGSKDAERNANAEASKLQREVDKYIKQMETLARSAAPSQRRPMQESLEKLRSEANAVRQALMRANDSLKRDDLLSGRSAADRAELDARERMINTTETAARGTAKLHQAQAVLSETEDLGITVIDTMQQQREQILRTTTTASTVNSLTNTAKHIVIGIQRRAVTNVFILGFAIIVLFGMIGVVVYFGYIKD